MVCEVFVSADELTVRARASAAHGGGVMARVSDKTRLSPPLMHVFRAAHEAKDAKKKVDIRNEAGERIIAGRRLRARQVITESVLRREVARDLDALLNAVAMESTVDLSQAALSCANRSSISAFPTFPTAPSTRMR